MARLVALGQCASPWLPHQYLHVHDFNNVLIRTDGVFTGFYCSARLLWIILTTFIHKNDNCTKTGLAGGLWTGRGLWNGFVLL